MTLPSRRKRQITALKALEAKASRPSGTLLILSSAMMTRCFLASLLIATAGGGFFFSGSVHAAESLVPNRWNPPLKSLPMASQEKQVAQEKTKASLPAVGEKEGEAIISGSTGLKWKTKRPASFKLARKNASVANLTKTPSGEDQFRQSGEIEIVWYTKSSADANHSPIQQAAHLSALDPFLDPFGDRLAQKVPIGEETNTPERDLNPVGDSASDEIVISPETPPNDPVETPVLPPEEPEEDFDFQDDDDDNNFGNLQQNLNSNSAVSCSENLGKCQTGLDLLKNSSITQISLDITPSYNPDPQKSSAEVAAERKEALADTESRTWENQRGKVLAVGRMIDFKNGNIWVETEDGSIAKLPFRQLNEESLCFVTDNWKLPPECTLGAEDFQVRDWTMLTFSWKASGLCHKPLYFEERQLERYGHSAGPWVQPVLSGAHFFANIALLPYKIGMTPPYECIYALGNYQVGDCAPYLTPPIPLSVRGGLTAGSIYTGLGFILP